MVELPSYVTIVSPRQSSPMHHQNSAVQDGIEQVTHDDGRPTSLDSHFNNAFHRSGNSGWSEAFDSLDEPSDPTTFHDDKQNQVDSASWATFLDNSLGSFSPGRRSSMPTPSRRDLQAARMENTSPRMRQITSIPAEIPAAQTTHDNDFALFDLNLGVDFSAFLNSPHILSTSPSSPHTALHPHRSIKTIGTSTPQLTDHSNVHRDNRELDIISRTTPAADQALDLVTRDDISAESITFLLLSLKSLVFPRFDLASQKYEYGNSILPDLFNPQLCDWLCSELEKLLDLYLERSLRFIRKRQIARIQSSLPSACNSNLNERRQGIKFSDLLQHASKSTESTVATRTPTNLFRYLSMPMGKVLFEGREGSASSMGEESIELARQINIAFMPHGMEQTHGLCVRMSRMRDGPTITPQIKTFNVDPDDSAIRECPQKRSQRCTNTFGPSNNISSRR